MVFVSYNLLIPDGNPSNEFPVLDGNPSSNMNSANDSAKSASIPQICQMYVNQAYKGIYCVAIMFRMFTSLYLNLAPL
jgi:hypothetical protein